MPSRCRKRHAHRRRRFRDCSKRPVDPSGLFGPGRRLALSHSAAAAAAETESPCDWPETIRSLHRVRIRLNRYRRWTEREERREDADEDMAKAAAVVAAAVFAVSIARCIVSLRY